MVSETKAAMAITSIVAAAITHLDAILAFAGIAYLEKLPSTLA
jgi:hypothetical protein